MTTTQSPNAMVSATPDAVVELKRLLENEAEVVTGVRMAVKGGGCSGSPASLVNSVPTTSTSANMSMVATPIPTTRGGG